MQTKFVLTEGSKGMFYLKMYDVLTNRELCTLLFDELTKSGSSKIDRIKIVDLTGERFKGYGTATVKHFINHCKEHHQSSILVYGVVYHQEIADSNTSQQDKKFHRDRRNRFWQKFGFKVTLKQDSHDEIEANLLELLEKTR